MATQKSRNMAKAKANGQSRTNRRRGTKARYSVKGVKR
jgi:hypothetical protein